MSKKAQNVQEASRCKGTQGNTSESGIKCVCLNARSIINKKNEFNIMVDDIKPHIIDITESWANEEEHVSTRTKKQVHSTRRT